MISTILNGKRIFSFTGIKRLTRSTRAVIIPVEAQNDIIKTICDLSGSKKYAHGRLKQPANKVALTPMEPYSSKEANDISAPKIASTLQGIRAAMIPNTERIIWRMNFSPIIWFLDTGIVITFLLHFEFASLHLLTPDLRESEKIKLLTSLLSLAATLRLRPAPKNRRKQQISPGRSQTHRAKEEVVCS